MQSLPAKSYNKNPYHRKIALKITSSQKPPDFGESCLVFAIVIFLKSFWILRLSLLVRRNCLHRVASENGQGLAETEQQFLEQVVDCINPRDGHLRTANGLSTTDHLIVCLYEIQKNYPPITKR